MPNNRRVARECALKMLFAHRFEETAGSAQRLLEDFWTNFRFADDALGEPLETVEAPLPSATRLFAEEVVKGVVDYRSVIDQKISAAAKNWSIGRMTAVDLAILRIGVYELLYKDDVPIPVTINEAVEIAKRYGTKESPSFINGLLDKIAKGVQSS
jgi:N utilization substance protein B